MLTPNMRHVQALTPLGALYVIVRLRRNGCCVGVGGREGYCYCLLKYPFQRQMLVSYEKTTGLARFIYRSFRLRKMVTITSTISGKGFFPCRSSVAVPNILHTVIVLPASQQFVSSANKKCASNFRKIRRRACFSRVMALSVREAPLDKVFLR